MPKPQRIELLERATAYQGYFRIDRYRLRHELFDGGMSGIVEREIFERGHSVAVLPYDPVLDAVVLIEQFRIGPYARGDRPWLVETVAGIVEDGEDAAHVAVREAKEEAGLEVTDLVALPPYYCSPGGTSEFVRLFVGRVDASNAGGTFGLDEEHEDIRVFVCALKEILKKYDDGVLPFAPLAATLQWLDRHKSALRHRWGMAPEPSEDEASLP